MAPSKSNILRPQWYKKTIAVIVCLAMLWCNFLAAGPTVAIVSTTMSFFPASDPAVDPAGFSVNVTKVAFFYTTTALLQGTGNFVWVPLANKYGRRPVYIVSYVSLSQRSVFFWVFVQPCRGGNEHRWARALDDVLIYPKSVHQLWRIASRPIWYTVC